MHLFCLYVGLSVIVTCTYTNPLLGSAPKLGKERSLLLKGLRTRGLLGKGELKLRTSLLFRSEDVARLHNLDPGREFNMALNKFSAMTSTEKSLYLGVENATLEHVQRSPRLFAATSSPPAQFNHRDHGHVTTVKDQQSCGSCWAFAGVGAFEGSYAIATGVLKSFSEKEALDCSYPEWKDGCRGGWYTAVWNYVKSAGRLASMWDIPYFPAVDKCSRWTGKPNGIRNADYIAYYRAPADSLERILSSYTPAVAFTVEDDFYAYKDGLYNGCHTPKRVNHGVILVGYGPQFWEAKNSWGSDWGDGGFVKFTRSRDNVCQITSRAIYPVVIGRDRGEPDQPDVLPDDDLENVALHKTVRSSDGVSVPDAVDGDIISCYSTKASVNPYFKLDLGKTSKVQRVEIVTGGSSDMIGSKVHIGNRGDFMDKRVGVISAVKDNTATIELEQPVEGSRVYWEYYSPTGPKVLSVCEIRVFAGGSDQGGACPSGTTLCPDGICRHAHMC